LPFGLCIPPLIKLGSLQKSNQA